MTSLAYSQTAVFPSMLALSNADRIERITLQILIVDDDVIHGRSVRDVLAAHNYPASVADTGQGGLARLREAHQEGNPFQVLILDLHIPDLMGVDILQAIKEERLKVKTIVLSGENELSSVAPILKLGAYDYLRKPFHAPELVTAVANALSTYQLEQENQTMQRQAEEDARLYQFLLNASPDLIYMLDEKGHFQFINHQLDGIFDVDYNTLIGAHWRYLFVGREDLIEQLGHHFNERRTGIRATVAEEFSYITATGAKHALELSAIGLYQGRKSDNSGNYIGTYGVIRDVTESKRTRRELEQSQRKFYSLFADSPDAIFIARLKDGQIIERNPNFATMCQVMGVLDDQSDAFLWTPGYQRADFVAGLEANPEHFDWTFKRDVQGEERYFEIRARQLELEGTPCMVASLRDRTHERRAEEDRLMLQEQTQQAGRMEAIGQVAGGIAHDFNNILASIIGYAELIQNSRTRLDEEQVNKYLGEVVTAGHRARDLISQMLNFTRAQRGEARNIDIHDTIADVSRMLRAAIPSSVAIDTDFADDLPSVVFDPVQIQQIIINLLVNASDAITGNGHIMVRARVGTETSKCHTCGAPVGADCVVISVKDDGHGIPADLLDKVFEMHFTTRGQGQGTGFGLWTINNILHEHRAHITVDSKAGQGTEFRIYLPTADTQLDNIAPVDIPVPQMAGRIVVVDDEVSVANFIGEVLRDKGYPTVVFTESPQALDYLQRNSDSVALLLTDGSMPLITGVELIEKVRAFKEDLPVIYITAFTQSTDAQSLNKLGVNRYLQKPFSIDEMLAAIADLTHADVNS
jgi:PAS domain S-box-containing protein